jgi:hypothetical protein
MCWLLGLFFFSAFLACSIWMIDPMGGCDDNSRRRRPQGGSGAQRFRRHQLWAIPRQVVAIFGSLSVDDDDVDLSFRPLDLMLVQMMLLMMDHSEIKIKWATVNNTQRREQFQPRLIFFCPS